MDFGLFAWITDVAERLEHRLGEIDSRLKRIERLLAEVITKEMKLMAFADDILAAIADEDTAIDSVIAFIKNNPAIPGDVQTKILNAINSDKARLQAALVANVPNPVVVALAAPNGTVGTSYTDQATATGGTSPYVFSVSTGSLPAGLSMDASGAVSGTPTVAGASTFSVTATDAKSATGTGTFTITIS